jgi:hypothetical protein
LSVVLSALPSTAVVEPGILSFLYSGDGDHYLIYVDKTFPQLEGLCKNTRNGGRWKWKIFSAQPRETKYLEPGRDKVNILLKKSEIEQSK